MLQNKDIDIEKLDSLLQVVGKERNLTFKELVKDIEFPVLLESRNGVAHEFIVKAKLHITSSDDNSSLKGTSLVLRDRFNFHNVLGVVDIVQIGLYYGTNNYEVVESSNPFSAENIFFRRVIIESTNDLIRKADWEKKKQFIVSVEKEETENTEVDLKGLPSFDVILELLTENFKDEFSKDILKRIFGIDITTYLMFKAMSSTISKGNPFKSTLDASAEEIKGFESKVLKESYEDKIKNMSKDALSVAIKMVSEVYKTIEESNKNTKD